MEELLLSEGEHRLMEVLWKHAPIMSGELVKVCENELDWNKSTTYTVLRKLKAKQAIENIDSLVTVLVSKDRVRLFESRRFIKKSFEGSLPSFLVSFLGDRTLSDSEADELIEIIDKYRHGTAPSGKEGYDD